MVCKVLVLDDDADVQESLVAALKIMLREGVEVMATGRGVEAVDLFCTNGGIALAILDIGLPDLNGWTVAEMIRKRDARVPIYLFTGWAFQRDQHHSKTKFVDGVFVKPVTLDQVKEILVKHNLYGG